MALKRLVTSAAIAILGCGSDAATDGADLPEFSGALPSIAAGTPAVNERAAPAVEGASPDPASEAEASGAPPVEQQPSIEGQNPDDVPLEGGEGAPAAPTEGDVGGVGQPSDTPVAGPVETPVETPPPPPAIVIPPLDCGAPARSLNDGDQICSSNQGGRAGPQQWYMWSSGTGGCITTYEEGAFSATWNNSGDFLARMGIQWDETQTFDAYGTVGADLAFTKSGSAGGYSFIGIYGWSNEPLIEYYIVENSFGNGPAQPFGGTQRGTYDIDGATYRFYTSPKNNQPSIHGTTNFTQYFAVRQSPRECGHVSISGHFQQWANMGMGLGKMYEARILVEAGGGQGAINFTHANVTATSDGN